MAKQRVLLISQFHPELIPGGAQQVCYELFQGLRAETGVQPTLLASATKADHPALFKSGARITGFDRRPDEFLFLMSGYDYWWHKSADWRALQAFAEFLEQTRPDVVHFHHFLTLGIDLLTLTRRVLPRARIVYTFHEFASICAADGQMVRRTDRSLCEQASQVRCHQCFPERSPEEFFTRQLWMQRHLAAVDVFACPARFMLDRYARWGLPREKLFHVENGLRQEVPAGARAGNGGAPRKRNRFGFFGQLLDAKGVQVLLAAAERLREEKFTDFSIELNGGNLQYASPGFRTEVQAFLDREAQRPASRRNVRSNGSYSRAELSNRMARIDWCVVPSLWTEGAPLVIAEAMAYGKPIICSNVGAMAERVADGITGLHFPMGDADALASTLKRASTEKGLWQRLAAAVPEPPTRDGMVAAYRKLYARRR